MTLEQKTITTIVAEEGKTLRRISDGRDCGERITLGYNYYEAGLPLQEPRLELPTDYEEVDAPKEEEEQPADHEADIRRLKLATRIIRQYKDSIDDLGLTDEEALEVKEWYLNFSTDIKVGNTLAKGQRVLYEGKLYNVLSDHTVLPLVYPSDPAASELYSLISTPTEQKTD